MFKKNFVRLCNKINKPPTVVCIELGLNKATFSNWKDDSVPHARTLEKIADYFGVSVEVLLSEEKETPTIDDERSELLRHYDAATDEGRSALLALSRQLKQRKQEEP